MPPLPEISIVTLVLSGEVVLVGASLSDARDPSVDSWSDCAESESLLPAARMLARVGALAPSVPLRRCCFLPSNFLIWSRRRSCSFCRRVPFARRGWNPGMGATREDLDRPGAAVGARGIKRDLTLPRNLGWRRESFGRWSS